MTKDALEKIEKAYDKDCRKATKINKKDASIEVGFPGIGSPIYKATKSFYRTALSTLIQQVGEEVGKMKRKCKHVAHVEPCNDSETLTYNKAIDDVRSRLDSVISSYKKE